MLPTDQERDAAFKYDTDNGGDAADNFSQQPAKEPSVYNTQVL